MFEPLQKFFNHEAAGGVFLIVATLLALIAANTAFAPTYNIILSTYFTVEYGGTGVSKPLLLWVNDGLMAIFFLYVGLELKQELREGKLKNPRDVILPALAAVGGMVVPALIYLWFNYDTPEAIGGWAIPAATDIAFALGVLAMLGKRVPASLKVFLLTLAILDDMGAIIIIAFFYTDDLHINYLVTALMPLAILIGLNLRGTHRIAPAILAGIVLWVLVLKSGIHATLSGVIIAFCIPLYDRFDKSPLHRLEHGLSPYVAFVIVPIFAFANAGVSLKGLTAEQATSGITLGIVFGLVAGKVIGILLATLLCTKTGIAQKPYGATWQHIFGVALLAGIGFTMSLFIGGLSFDSDVLMNEVRLGVLVASLIASVAGALVLISAPKPMETPYK